jgi:TusA-related sulfurtransferase
MSGKKDDSMLPAAVVDALGLFCPLPVIKTERKLRKLAPGEVIRVLSDDPTFPTDITSWCKKTGNKLVELQGKGGAYDALIQKKTGTAV